MALTLLHVVPQPIPIDQKQRINVVQIDQAYDGLRDEQSTNYPFFVIHPHRHHLKIYPKTQYPLNPHEQNQPAKLQSH